MQTTFKEFNDPGHGWLKVPRALLEKLGIVDKISGFSFEHGDHIYLEEDDDMSTFLDAMTSKNPTVNIQSRHTNHPSRIRSFKPYTL